MIKHRKLILIILLLFIETAVLIFFGFQKKGMHFDEFFSYFNTNNSYGREAYDRSWVSSENIKKDFYVLPGEQFNYSRVVELQSYDVHPPVYYLLLHTVCSFMVGTYSMWQGIGLNIFFSLILTVFLFLIINRFTGNDYVSALFVLMIILCPGVISNVMFIRMYSLMTLFMILQVYIHILMEEFKSYKEIPLYLMILSALITYLGFLTHYFYLVFLFFLEAAFIIPHLKNFKEEIRPLIKYCILIAFSGILGVISYPACLGQVNSGYRGVEVRGYMTDVSDIGMRLKFFGGLINTFVFNNTAYFILLLICLLLITAYYKRSRAKMTGESNKSGSSNDIGLLIRCLIIPVLGYFLISAKGSLIGDEAMMRYQLPIYSLILAITAILIYKLIFYLSNDNKRILTVFILIFGVFYIFMDIVSLKSGKVYYRYPENENRIEICASNSDKTCIYIFNSENNKYFLWSDADQLWQFDDVYFADINNPETIMDSRINDSEELIVFISKLDEREDFNEYIDLIKRSDPKVTSHKKLYDTAYATVYEFY